MSSRQLKTGYFILEGLNSFGTVYYSYYLYFFMQKEFGFDNKANLTLAALNGLICMFAAWWGGKFAQKFGYFTALKLGFAIMACALAVGSQVNTALCQVLVMAGMVIGMCFTWPTLEALVSEGETPERLPAMIGSYNVVWAGTGALAYFSGGAMLDKFGLRNMFYVPAAIFLVQLGFTFWIESKAGQSERGSSDETPTADPGGFESRLATEKMDPSARPSPLPKGRGSRDAKGTLMLGTEGTRSLPVLESSPRPIAKGKTFLRMAWLANPFAYIAINTLIAVIPAVATRLGLSATLAGFYCSIWCFARVAAFFALWWWEGWHYRFSWLLAAYLTILGTFTILLLAPNLLVLIAAQVVFGLALGLIYYSSLFYSMDVGETKGEHGGIHEAAIGLGNFAGPAVGAASLHFLPQYANSGAIAVSGLLLLGLGGLVAIWRFSSSSS
ncbi:MAG: hypothetical protein QOJ40_570 [Verrucomicrobiota bacterium]